MQALPRKEDIKFFLKINLNKPVQHWTEYPLFFSGKQGCLSQV